MIFSRFVSTRCVRARHNKGGIGIIRRQRGSRAAEKRNEGAARRHSITSSARASSASGHCGQRRHQIVKAQPIAVANAATVAASAAHRVQ
jgi:hypothetical protein